MKALRKTNPGYNQMRYTNVVTPDLKEDEVKIRVLFTGICGSDIHNFKGEYTKVTPLTLGHEFSGEIVEVGESVERLEVGDIVSSETTFEVCEKCPYCLKEEYNLCSQRKGLGTQIDGSFAEYVIAKASRCHKIPDNITPQVAAMLEPLACCVHAVMEKTAIQSGETIAVFGPGPIGLLMSLVLKTYQVTVILIGITQDKKRLQLASTLGIDQIIDSQTCDLTSKVASLTDNLGVDYVFECSGSPVALRQAFQISKKQGTIIQEGLFAKDMIPIDMSLLIHKEIQYIGSRTQKPSSWLKSLDLLESEKIDLTPLVSAVYPLAEWEQAFQKVMAGDDIKVLLQP
ncbi:zinc-binding dehydrogenase [Vagococcus sp. BWB3-3]|uniref:Zinc-binding dehydrogenase n=1 Tax=Vagococcus allomyrinae TaxID=2794353 RepID=A0A940SW08_9ENTE|nr:zinc-binding dehydrogenase [Vagococcus allomyrinae]MBP1040888.1 zinc-binding dehydrogenase [Vagococcus allomyrinae]